MSERRIRSRKRVVKKATIVLNQTSCLDCGVKNLSATGACLEVASPIGIPDNFTLVVESESLRRPCVVTWRTIKRVGVVFQ